MKLVRLEVAHLGGIRSAELDFGPGLNVLHGPNDLGKSTIAQAIRMALLLPSTSSAHEPWVPWGGGHRPVVDLVFHADERYWRVRKEFGAGNNASLKKSVDRVNWDEVARGRAVDGEVRKLLAWGIAEPGGSAPRGVGTSFLATALLSTQADVAAILDASLEGDSADGGKQRVAEALQALAQDPLFKHLIDAANEEYDKAFTAQGRKKMGQAGVLKIAAERVKKALEARDEAAHAAADAAAAVDRLKAHVVDVDVARDRARRAAEAVERLALQRAYGAAKQEVDRLTALAADVDRLAGEVASSHTRRTSLAGEIARAEERKVAAELALRQQEEASKQAFDEGALALERMRLESALAVARAEGELAQGKGRAGEAKRRLDEREGQLRADAIAAEEIDRLERLVELRAAELDLTRLAAQRKRSTELREAALEKRKLRGQLVVPDRDRLKALAAIERQNAVAQGKLAVGLAVTVEPKGALRLAIAADGEAAWIDERSDPVSVEAKSTVTVEVPGAVIRIAAGTADVREAARQIAETWTREAVPVLRAAGVATVDALGDRVTTAEQLDREIKALDDESARLGPDPGPRPESELHTRTEMLRAGLGDIAALEPTFLGLGSDPRAALRLRREKLRASAKRDDIGVLRTAAALADQAVDTARIALEAATGRRAACGGPALGEVEAQAALDALRAGEEGRRTAREQGLASARAKVEAASNAVEVARKAHADSIAAVATLEGLLSARRQQLAGEDVPAAESALADALARLGEPPRPVSDVEVDSARTKRIAAEGELSAVEQALHRAQGALEQVGGAVADERLAEAEEALAIAEQQERAVEAEYDAWRMLREHLVLAEQAQASNLGQALAPSVSESFAALTGGRYGGLALTAHLGTNGIVAQGQVRDVDRLSVGTREQLSTLYRLCLAERLGSALVLDDQLVQSDVERLGWFRELLTKKAELIQIVVMTCRPEDYLRPGASATHAVDLAAALRR